MTLHTFVDVSQQAYGAACYTRHFYEYGTVRYYLVASRSRVHHCKLSERTLDVLVRQHGRNLLGSWTEQKFETVCSKSCWWNPSLDTFWQKRIQLICWRGDLVSKLSLKKKVWWEGRPFWSITCLTGQGWKCKLKETQTATSRNCSKNRCLFAQLWSNA